MKDDSIFDSKWRAHLPVTSVDFDLFLTTHMASARRVSMSITCFLLSGTWIDASYVLKDARAMQQSKARHPVSLRSEAVMQTYTITLYLGTHFDIIMIQVSVLHLNDVLVLSHEPWKEKFFLLTGEMSTWHMAYSPVGKSGVCGECKSPAIASFS